MKKKPSKLLTVPTGILLLFNGVGALYGGWNLITHPDGSTIQLSMHWLEHTPFDDYFIPGIILFLCNGVFSFVALLAIILQWKNYFYFISAQGLILVGWIVIQMMMIQTINFLHIVMGITGVLLIILGRLLK